jgi:hypothetical protein
MKDIAQRERERVCLRVVLPRKRIPLHNVLMTEVEHAACWENEMGPTDLLKEEAEWRVGQHWMVPQETEGKSALVWGWQRSHRWEAHIEDPKPKVGAVADAKRKER